MMSNNHGVAGFRDLTRRRMLAESALSDEARARYLFRFHDRLKAIAQ